MKKIRLGRIVLNGIAGILLETVFVLIFIAIGFLVCLLWWRIG